MASIFYTFYFNTKPESISKAFRVVSLFYCWSFKRGFWSSYTLTKPPLGQALSAPFPRSMTLLKVVSIPAVKPVSMVWASISFGRTLARFYSFALWMSCYIALGLPAQLYFTFILIIIIIFIIDWNVDVGPQNWLYSLGGDN